MAKIKNVNPVGNSDIDGVLSGYAWADKAIQYAFPIKPSDYGYSGEKGNNFSGFNPQLRNAALYILEEDYGGAANNGFSVEGLTHLRLNEGGNKTAEIRFGFSATANPTAYAYYPSNNESGGDVWMGTAEKSYRFPVAGNDAWLGLMHEIGHSLGLKHGHEAENGFGAISNDHDSLEYTIMTYNTFVGDNAGSWKYEKWGAPQTFMMADIAALQTLYGADYSTNSGNTTYKWGPGSGDTRVNGKVAIDAGGNRIFATIWDGGGKDTYDLSAYGTKLDIDLRPGEFSVFKNSQLANLNAGNNNHIASGNIYNALLHNNDKRSLIENAFGGSNDDNITGNTGANRLEGRGGSDLLAGLRGNDVLVGGGGADQFYFDFDSDHDTITKLEAGDQIYLVIGAVSNADDALVFATQKGNDTVFDFGEGNVLTVLGLDLSTLDDNDFIIGGVR